MIDTSEPVWKESLQDMNWGLAESTPHAEPSEFEESCLEYPEVAEHVRVRLSTGDIRRAVYRGNGIMEVDGSWFQQGLYVGRATSLFWTAWGP